MNVSTAPSGQWRSYSNKPDDSDEDGEGSVSTSHLRVPISTLEIRNIGSLLSALQLPFPKEERSCRRKRIEMSSSHHSVSAVVVDYGVERIAHLMKHAGMNFISVGVTSTTRFLQSHEPDTSGKIIDTVVSAAETGGLHLMMGFPHVAVTAGVVATMKLQAMVGHTIEEAATSLPLPPSTPSIDGTTFDEIKAIAQWLQAPQNGLDQIHEKTVSAIKGALD